MLTKKTYIAIILAIASLIVVNPVQAKLRVEYREINISGGLGAWDIDEYGPYTPWSIKIKMNSVYMGFTYVEVVCDGDVVWDGSLGTGQSSPWISTNGETTYVYVGNYDFEWITYAGKICMYAS